MISWVKPKIPRKLLILILSVSLAGACLVQITQVKVKYSHYDDQVMAAKTMESALRVLKEERLNLGIPINKELDPNETGIVGEPLTVITSSQGNLEAKRTSTNPDFAALIVRLFHEVGLEKGDVVAIGASGSFPGLILATLAACEALELEPLLIYSVGASMYGANLPEFTFIEMLDALRKNEVLLYEIMAVSLGGGKDRGEGMLFPESQEVMLNIVNLSGVPVIFESDTKDSIEKRLFLYADLGRGEPPACFVNIGGATPNYGGTSASLSFPNGLVLGSSLKSEDPERGLIFEYQALGVPVIHLLNIRDLALKFAIPIDPVPFPKIGSGNIYYQTQYNKYLIWVVVILAIGVLVLGVVNHRKYQG